MPNSPFGPNVASAPAPEQPNAAGEPEQRAEQGPNVKRSNAPVATAARVLKKRRRWADEMNSADWLSLEPEQVADLIRAGRLILE